MANRYWVEGQFDASSGRWNNTEHWSTSSGGAGGASVPGPSDTAIFDSNSFAQVDGGEGICYLDTDITVGAINATGSQIRRVLFCATTPELETAIVMGTPRTIIAGSVSLTDVDFMDIVGAGAATWSGTRIGDYGGNSGITFTTSRNLFWVSTDEGQVFSVTIAAGGSGYSNGQTLTISGGGTIPCLLRITGVSGGGVTAVSLFNGNQRGGGYTTGVHATTVNTGGGTGCTIDITEIRANYNDTGRWSLTSGGAGGQPIPLPQDNVFFDSNSFTPTDNLITTYPQSGLVGAYTRTLGKNVDFSDSTNNPVLYLPHMDQWEGFSNIIMGDFILNSGVTLQIVNINGGQGYSMWGRNNVTFDFAGATVVGVGFWMAKYGGKITLASDWTTGFNEDDYPASYITAGTIDANDFDFFFGELYVDIWMDEEAIYTRDYDRGFIMGSGTWSGWYLGCFIDPSIESRFTIVCETSTITNINNTNTYDFWLITPTGCGAFNNIVMTRYVETNQPFFTYSREVRCQNLTITTDVVDDFSIDFEPEDDIYNSYFYINGLLTMTGVEGGLIYIFGGNLVANESNISFVEVGDNNALGNVPFQAVPGGVDLGGNTNWCFPGTCGNFIDYNPSIITAVAKVGQDLPFPKFIMAGKGGADGDDFVLFKKSDTYGFSVWRTKVYKIGYEFDVKRIAFNMLSPIRNGTELVPVLRFDNEDRVQHAPSINLTNYPKGDKFIELTSKNFSNKVHGYDSFFFELQSTGEELATVALPIFIELEIYDGK